MILNIRYAQPISLLFHNLKIERDRIDFLDSLHKKILLLHKKEIWMCCLWKRIGPSKQALSSQIKNRNFGANGSFGLSF